MRRLLALILAAACGAVLAQATVYRSTMPDGKKVISDRPMPGAVKVEELAVSRGNTAPGNPITKSTPAVGDRSSALATAQANLRKAQEDYDKALADQVKGREERPGDRQGTAKGGARFTGAYEARQEELKAAVDAAKLRLDDAQRKLNAVR